MVFSQILFLDDNGIVVASMGEGSLSKDDSSLSIDVSVVLL